MYNYTTVIDILRSGCHYIILQVLFENDTLIQVRYCHLLGICSVFNVILFLFFDSSHDKINVDIYLKIFGSILVSYTHQI